jgi:NAD(P)-dependent dehydrogenase (short-subunit alcohol dehydrogenase family)
MSSDLSLEFLFKVSGKVVLVTGGGSGIGKMIASGFARNGAKVYIAARKEDQLKEAVADINKVASGPKAEYIVANVGSRAGCDALIAEFCKREDKIHVLVNNAGTTWGGSFKDFPEKGWDNIFNVNVKSIFYMTAGLSDLLAEGSTNLNTASVINISSLAAFEPQSEGALSSQGNGTWSYQPSKAAVNHLTSSLAVKLAPQHITVNAICPGIFPSKMTAFGFNTVGAETLAANSPTGRYGAPSDIAGLALFLSSPAASHLTGAHIILDGGSRHWSPGSLLSKL